MTRTVKEAQMSATVFPATMSFRQMAGQWVPRWLYELTLGLFRNTHRTYSQYGQDAVLLSYLSDGGSGRPASPPGPVDISTSDHSCQSPTRTRMRFAGADGAA